MIHISRKLSSKHHKFIASIILIPRTLWFQSHELHHPHITQTIIQTSQILSFNTGLRLCWRYCLYHVIFTNSIPQCTNSIITISQILSSSRGLRLRRRYRLSHLIFTNSIISVHELYHFNITYCILEQGTTPPPTMPPLSSQFHELSHLKSTKYVITHSLSSQFHELYHLTGNTPPPTSSFPSFWFHELYHLNHTNRILTHIWSSKYHELFSLIVTNSIISITQTVYSKSRTLDYLNITNLII